jgi:hypothetical protein
MEKSQSKEGGQVKKYAASGGGKISEDLEARVTRGNPTRLEPT